MKKTLEHKVSLPLKLLIMLSLLVIIAMISYFYVDKTMQQRQIIAAIAELESYRTVMQEYYQEKKALPPVGKIFAQALNPQGRAGCDVEGSCVTYYERLLEDPKKAFMAKTVIDINKPNVVFMAFIERDNKIITYCGPWAYKNDSSITLARLPKTCNSEIKKVLGL